VIAELTNRLAGGETARSRIDGNVTARFSSCELKSTHFSNNLPPRSAGLVLVTARTTYRLEKLARKPKEILHDPEGESSLARHRPCRQWQSFNRLRRARPNAILLQNPFA
jgi:hypothetical protein